MTTWNLRELYYRKRIFFLLHLKIVCQSNTDHFYLLKDSLCFGDSESVVEHTCACVYTA